MKKILTIISLSFSLLFSACGKEEASRTESVKIQGEIKSLGNFKVSENVTHLIETRDDKIIYAYSEKYNLNDTKYKDTLLDIQGTLYYFDSFDKPQLSIENIQIATEESGGQEKEWVPHQNELLGLSYEAINTWLEQDLANGLRFESIEDEAFIKVELTENTYLEPEEWVSLEKESWSKMTGEAILFGDEIQGFEYRNGNQALLIFMREDKIYSIESQWNESDMSKSNYLTFIQSLTMIPFHFGEEEALNVAPQNLPQMTKAESQGVNLSFEYPSSWYYLGDSSGFILSEGEIHSTQAEARIYLSKNPKGGKAFQDSKTLGSTVWTIEADSGYEAIAKHVLNSLQTLSQ